MLHILQKFSSSVDISFFFRRWLMMMMMCRREMKSDIRQTDLFPFAFEFKMVDAATLKMIPAIK